MAISEILSTAGFSQHTPSILVIDDDPVNLRIVTEYLLESHYTILIAEDGDSGVARAVYALPDLILLDVMMPGLDGYETCRRLKSLETTRDIPVIFMTALVDTDHKVRGFDAGAVDYITKPFQREEVLARVQVHLRIRELASKLQEAKETLEKRVEERTVALEQANRELQAEIIERKQAEEERERLVTAIEQAAEAIVITDAQWIISYVNPAFERLNGYSRNEITGQHIIILKSYKQDPQTYRNLQETLSRGEVWSGRLTNAKKDRTFFEAEVTVSPVRDKTGTIINYVSIHRDITLERKLERDLRQAQKMEAIGTLAGGIAHDFNNILTAIIGFTQIALYKIPEGNPARQSLSRVLESVSRATDMVRQILTFSRRTELEQKPVQIASIIKEVLNLLRSSLPSTIEIRQDIAIGPDRDTVLADSTQIYQVLMNLSTNAAHAMRTDGGTLNIGLGEVEVDASLVARCHDLKPGPYLRLTVSDTGHGMDTSVLERIFDPFFTTKEPGEGTGMGLAVVQGIVRSHGGAVAVHSEPRQGTTFHIFLPVIRKAIPHEAAIPAPVLTGTERILFVDDEKTLTELGLEMLETLGYSITATTSSLEALQIFSSSPDDFDLIITDMTMPGLTGKDLSHKMMALRPDIPIILCTGYSDLISSKKARESGIREFLMKPYEANTLATTIRKVLDDR